MLDHSLSIESGDRLTNQVAIDRNSQKSTRKLTLTKKTHPYKQIRIRKYYRNETQHSAATVRAESLAEPVTGAIL